ncbi:hypothetical protein [Methanosarcina virus MetMV]|jgi:hypothetical protein|nr:hypothetical protein [Methanosarcina virus MetMV]
MGRVNLQGLINEVLDMVKKRKGGTDDIFALNSKEEREREDDLLRKGSEEAYLKELRGRNTQLDVGKQTNAGALNVARETNAGALARQTLMEDTDRLNNARTYNLGLYKERVNENLGRFNAQTMRQEIGKKYNQDDILGTLGLGAKGQPTIKQEPTMKQETTKKGEIVVPTGNDKGSFITPDISGGTSVKTPIPVVKNVPSTPTLEQRENEFNRTRRSATGFSFFNSPKEVEANKQYWDTVQKNATRETDEERKKRQARNRLRAGLS